MTHLRYFNLTDFVAITIEKSFHIVNNYINIVNNYVNKL